MITRSKGRPQVPGGSSNSAGRDENRSEAGSRGAKNLRAASIPRQTTQAMNMDTEMLSDRNPHSNLSTPSPYDLVETPSSSPRSYEFYQTTSRSSTVSPVSEDVVQEALAIEPVPAPDANRARKRWSEEMNKFIWRTYLIATKLKTSKIYLNHLHREFTQKYPEMQASKQRLGDQCRAIVRNKLLVQATLDQITEEVTEYLQQQTVSHTHSQTLTQQAAGQRRRWTTEWNECIVRNYYRLTELGENRSAYRQPLYQAVIAQFPELSQVSEQRISDQLRVILNNKTISDQRLQEIREDVLNYLNLHRNTQLTNSQQTLHQSHETEHMQETLDYTNTQDSFNVSVTGSQLLTELSCNSPVPLGLETENQIGDTHVQIKIREQFTIALNLFKNSNPTTRPYIPKQKTSKNLAQIVNFIDTKLLPNHVTRNQDFETTQTLIYCSAYTAAICNGSKIYERNSLPAENHKKIPAWQRRLECKIQKIRKDIGRMTEYIRGNRSSRLIRLVAIIKNTYRIHSQHEDANITDDQFLDTLKQKLNTAASRLKRYLNCTLRKTQNSQFINNEKQFYRSLSLATQKETTHNPTSTPDAVSLHTFWSNIWSIPVSHNPNAECLEAESELIDKILPMQFEHIPIEVFGNVLKNTHNWKAPGSDHIHNYWYKKFTTCHPFLHNHINDFIHTPNIIPKYVTQGLTYMIPKDTDTQNPAKYRPITCLQTIYKLLTACIAELIHQHVTKNNVFSEEQKGCRKSSQGCKEQLIIDSVAMKQAIAQKKDISTMYVDYRKAFDSVPHTWLLHVLERYKIHPLLIEFLKKSMQFWTTTLKTTGRSSIETEEIQIRRGIFQGDALSPLWFCLALNPLSHLLNKTNLGFEITTPQKRTPLTHLLYMDDIKLYSNTTQSLHLLADITQTFSNNICMDFGIDKCKTFSVQNGQITPNSYTLNSGDIIEPLDALTYYKYLGFQQARQINQKIAKNDLTERFKHRLNILLRSQLNSRNLIKSINSYAIPILTYSFGIINWTQNELITIQRIMNTSLTAHRKHHPRSCVQRMTLSRDEGGRGIIDVVNLHNKQITMLRHYFHQHSEHSSLHEIVKLADKNLTPLNLIDQNPQRNEKIVNIQEKIASWQQKSLHGRHRHDLQQSNVDKVASNAWLRRGELFPETEAFMIAIQDQVIDTRNYQKYIIRTPNFQSDTCRHCHAKPETIQHITSACKSLAQTDYKHRHDQVASIIHQHLAHRHNFIPKKMPYYKYKPAVILEDHYYKIYWDRTIITDKTIHFNRPDITLHDKTNKTIFLIDIAIPNTHNIQSTISEKLTKYQDLAIELKRQWRAETIHIVPIVISSTGIIPKSLQRSLDILQVPKHTLSLLQKAVILNTCRLTRKFLTSSSITYTIS